MMAATIKTGAPNNVEKIMPTIGIAMSAPSSTSKSRSWWRSPDERLTVKWRFSFLETLRSMESSSSGVALTAGEMLAPAEAEATAVPEAEGAGVGDWPNAGQAGAIEQRQVKIAVFIVVLWEGDAARG